MGASTCNSIIIEIYGDMKGVSHGFNCYQMLEYIAAISTFIIEWETYNVAGIVNLTL